MIIESRQIGISRGLPFRKSSNQTNPSPIPASLNNNIVLFTGIVLFKGMVLFFMFFSNDSAYIDGWRDIVSRKKEKKRAIIVFLDIDSTSPEC